MNQSLIIPKIENITEVKGISLQMDQKDEVKMMQKSLLQKDSLNIYVSMPCPLKIPFQQAFKPFVEKWNTSHPELPVYWPTVTDCSPEGIEKMMKAAKDTSELPDIFVTSAYNIIFSEKFRQKFLDSYLFGGFPTSFYSSDYPTSLIEAAENFHVGFLGFSSWGLIRDNSVEGDFPLPQQWNDLIKPEYKNLISVHGCHGNAASLSMLIRLRKDKDESAVQQFADNIHKVGHFAEHIKAMGTSKSKTPYYILPNVAIAHIPGAKNVKLVDLDGGIITPMMMIINQSKMEKYKDIIAFFTNPAFKELVEQSAYFQPRDVTRICTHSFDDLQILSEDYYDETEMISNRFIEYLGDKIHH